MSNRGDMFKVRRQRKVTYIDLKQVSDIVGLSEAYIRQLIRDGRFPKRHNKVGRARWSKLIVYNWLRRWGIRSERKRK